MSRLLFFLSKIIPFFWYIFERVFLISFLIVLTIGLAWWTSHDPSNYRDWSDQDTLLPTVSWSGDVFTVTNLRNHTWKTDKEFTPGYLSLSYDIREVEKMYYIITPFPNQDGPAHTMFSFTFSGGRHLVISPEIRKERGETFDALKGILNQFELQYVIATEDDVIKLRTNHRKNEVYMYPIRVEKEKTQALLRSMLIRANKLQKEPEFYNTLWNNCATSILAHANALRIDKLQVGRYTLHPSHSDQIVYSAGLIDTNLPIGEARSYYRIDEIGRNAGTGAIFSEIIRKPIR